MSEECLTGNQAQRLPQIIASVAVSSSTFCVGTALAWSSPSLPRISGDCQDCYFKQPFTDETGSWIAALLPIGCLFGSLIFGYVLENYGRKFNLMISALPYIVGFVVLFVAGPLKLGSAWFMVGRILSGLGAAGFLLGSSIYVVEISEPNIRGSLNTLLQLTMTLGLLFDNGVGALIEWDLLTGLCLIAPVILVISMWFMPETPYFLISQGNEQEAKQSLQWLRGRSYDITDEYGSINTSYNMARDIGTVNLKTFLTTRYYLKPGLIVAVLMAVQQLSGINAVLFYLTAIFEKAGTDLDPGLAATLVCLVRTIATTATIFLVEVVGRKVLLVSSSILMGISTMALGIYFKLEQNIKVTCEDNLLPDCTPQEGSITQEMMESLGWVPITAVIVFIIGIAIGYGPLPYAINAEFFSTESKGIASSLAISSSWFWAFLVPKLGNWIGVYQSYLFFCSVNFLAIPFVVFFVPETKGKSPEDMKRYFMKGENERKGYRSID